MDDLKYLGFAGLTLSDKGEYILITFYSEILTSALKMHSGFTNYDYKILLKPSNGYLTLGIHFTMLTEVLTIETAYKMSEPIVKSLVNYEKLVKITTAVPIDPEMKLGPLDYLVVAPSSIQYVG